MTQAPDAHATLHALAEQRPELVGPYTAALPGARAAVLGRLWGAIAREPIDGVGHRISRDGAVTVALADGRGLTGPADAAVPFAPAPAGLAVRWDGQPYDDASALLRALALPRAERLAAELANSVANLALARAAQPAPHGGPAALTGPAPHPAFWEQLVVDGHPLHPGCRTRLPMSTAEVLAYAPEHRTTVELRLVEVPARRWLATGAGLPPVLPLHPWQHDHVLDAHPWLRPTRRVAPARPLMSLRTVAPVAHPDQHWKTAVDVQMTSAVRTVSPAALRNGPVVTAFLAELTRPLDAITVLPETAAGAALVDGEPCRSLAVLVRQAPPGDAVPLAALAAPSPATGAPLVTEAVALGYAGDPVAFLADLAGVLLPPLLWLLRHGVALEAHGQNTLVVLAGGRPRRLMYRDVGGVRISPALLHRHGVEPPPLHGDLATDDPEELRTTLLAALGVVLGEQVAVLSRAYDVAPATLWAAIAATPLPEADRAVLTGPTLPVKATTAMRLASDPLEPIWARLPNPMAR
ncbi:Siderophore synthetase component [Micromonospora pattaloongensis]|uniref:Siderophore synthetase component n=1 Tax=Micromonospora pattaloongensis TaxID=405436 RepID=A0A1H3P591_9ACTN|nr:IucA/IucC family protein [Micromonospora pattaloongensis]SDY95559.1 Siderophore synthetase component [Micromonospora pattaloongensis]